MVWKWQTYTVYNVVFLLAECGMADHICVNDTQIISMGRWRRDGGAAQHQLLILAVSATHQQPSTDNSNLQPRTGSGRKSMHTGALWRVLCVCAKWKCWKITRSIDIMLWHWLIRYCAKGATLRFRIVRFKRSQEASSGDLFVTVMLIHPLTASCWFMVGVVFAAKWVLPRHYYKNELH